jgi:[protein-PII] uridylyltransferase
VINFIEEKNKLIQSLGEGRHELSFSPAYTALIDDYIKTLYGKTAEPARDNGVALLALGGYGRAEMAPFSDVDLLFLHESNQSQKSVENLIETVLYPLWDNKLDVGHASRTIEECRDMADRDFTVLISLMESRFLIGDQELFKAFMSEMRRGLGSKKRRQSFFKELKNNVDERHRKYGRSPYLLEPNVKEGQGGLRDIQAIMWAGQGLYEFRCFSDLARAEFLPKGSADELSQAREFMTRVRVRLHYLAGEKNDKLSFEAQEGLASRFKYKREGGISAVEWFMQTYYTHVYAVSHNLDHLLRRLEEDLRPAFLQKITKGSRTVEKGLFIQRGRVELASSADVRKRPALMMKAYDVAMNEGLEISHNALDLIQSNLDLVDDEYRADPEIARTFLSALVATPPPSATAPDNLEAMRGNDFLVAYIPELASVRARVQYDAYHVYTVDVHQILTLWELKKIAAGIDEEKQENSERSILEQVKNREELYLAAFIHDIGKGHGRDHASRGAEMARKIAVRLGLDSEAVETAAFLVAEHLFLIETATRRDLSEEKLILSCAQRVGDLNRLNMLYLLTVADSRATGAMAWNQWKAALLRDLYTKILHVLTRSDLAGKEAADRRERVKRKVKEILGKKMDSERIEAGLDDFPAHYLAVTGAYQVARHLQMEDKLGDDVMAWEVQKTENGYFKITLLTKDRPGLLASMSGVLSLNSVNILDAQVFTKTNGLAIDIFSVDSPPDTLYLEEAWAKVEQDVRKVLSGEVVIDFDKPFKRPVLKARRFIPRRPARVEVDNDTSDFYTLIEVYAHDRLGLLHDLAQVIFEAGLTIHIAKISTKVDQVVDVFYVHDFEGQKVDEPERIEELKKVLKAVL